MGLLPSSAYIFVLTGRRWWPPALRTTGAPLPPPPETDAGTPVPERRGAAAPPPTADCTTRSVGFTKESWNIEQNSRNVSYAHRHIVDTQERERDASNGHGGKVYISTLVRRTTFFLLTHSQAQRHNTLCCCHSPFSVLYSPHTGTKRACTSHVIDADGDKSGRRPHPPDPTLTSPLPSLLYAATRAPASSNESPSLRNGLYAAA